MDLTINEDQQDVVKLKKQLTILHGVSFIVNCMVGSGIFIAPQLVLLQSGSIGVSLLVWVICGILILFGSLTNIELGCMIPKAGGLYEYLLIGMHDAAAYIYGWTVMILISGPAYAAGALSFSNYLLTPFEFCGTVPFPKIALAICVIALFIFLNCRTIKLVTILQGIFAAMKAITLCSIVVSGCYGLAKGGYKHFYNSFENTSKSPMNISLAFHSALFTYSGWNGLNYLAEEFANPARSLPISISVGLAIVIAFYVLVNIAYIGVLTADEIKASETIVVSMMGKFSNSLENVFSIFVSLSIFGYLISEALSSPRVIFGAARHGHLPAVAKLLQMRLDTPLFAIAMLGIVATIFLAANDVSFLVYMMSFSEASFSVLFIIAFFLLRYKHPEMERPFKINVIFPAVFGVAMIAIVLISLVAAPASCASALAIMVGLLLFYPLTVLYPIRPVYKLYRKFIIVMQKIFLCAPEDE